LIHPLFGLREAIINEFDKTDDLLGRKQCHVLSCSEIRVSAISSRYEVDGDKYVAIITASRPDEPLRRKHVDIGTQDRRSDNTTGHGIIFLSRGDYVYCNVAPDGV
jgi:hypothetical protein